MPYLQGSIVLYELTVPGGQPPAHTRSQALSFRPKATREPKSEEAFVTEEFLFSPKAALAPRDRLGHLRAPCAVNASCGERLADGGQAQTDRRSFSRLALTQLSRLSISTDPDTDAWTVILQLADRFQLTLYDAAYLELAARRGLRLATLDQGLAGCFGGPWDCPAWR